MRFISKFMTYRLLKIITAISVIGLVIIIIINFNWSSMNLVYRDKHYQFHLNGGDFLPLCPTKIPKSTLQRKINLTAPSFKDLEVLHPDLNQDGRHIPCNCTPVSKVAIIIPFRDRDEHLSIFLQHMHPFLKNQYLDYTIFVIEQLGWKFNRGKLFNIGFVEALKIDQFPCFILHDVDLLPEVEHFMYTCYDQPRHMSVAVNKFDYKLPYASIFGGVVAMTLGQFQKVNGFSNVYYGWGGEDDDLSRRLSYSNMRIVRDNEEISRYTMILHENETPNPKRVQQLQGSFERWKLDGLSNLKYKVIGVVYEKLFTRILVDALPPE